MISPALLFQLQDGSPQERSDDRALRRFDAPSEEVQRENTGVFSAAFDLWRQLDDAAAARGIHLEVLLTLDASQHVDGGANEGVGAVRGLLDIIATVQTPPLGGELIVGVQGITGDDASTALGLVQAYSNIDAADDRVQVAKLWWQREDEGVLARVGLGKIDANELFAYVDNGVSFLHSSMGYSPTVLDFPTYPDPAFGAVCFLRGPSDVELRLGVFDGAFHLGRRTGIDGPGTVFGAPSDAFLIAEVGKSWIEGEAQVGRACVGAWRHTGEFARFDGGVDAGASGYYATLERGLEADQHRPELKYFLQLGWADPAVSPFERHVGAGAYAVHPFSERLDDRLGFGVSSVRLSDEPNAGFSRDSETAYELFYAFTPAPGVRIKPDLQYIASPGGDAALENAWVATLRLSLSF